MYLRIIVIHNLYKLYLLVLLGGGWADCHFCLKSAKKFFFSEPYFIVRACAFFISCYFYHIVMPFTQMHFQAHTQTRQMHILAQNKMTTDSRTGVIRSRLLNTSYLTQQQQQQHLLCVIYTDN